MRERLIPPTALEFVLRDPEQIIPTRDGRKAYQSVVEIDGRTFLVRAIVEDDVDPAVVVTVYRTSKIGKYRGSA